MAFSSSQDRGALDRMRTFGGPQQVDQMIGQAISMCWMMMPDDRKNVDAVAAEISRIVERALANLKEDAKAFGITDDK